jgi:hypothetical protein
MPIKAIIPRQANIGMSAAEADNEYFVDCFVETIDADAVISFSDPRCIVIGRTGGGKSAILRWIEGTKERVLRLKPESLSLNFLSDRWILQFLTQNDLSLHLFYQQLWRHVLVVELLRYEKQLSEQAKSESFIAQFKDRFIKNERKKKAFDYLIDSGGKFWVDTEERIRTIVDRLESDIETRMGLKISDFEAMVRANDSKVAELTREIVNNAKRVVNSQQMQELGEIINILDEDIFTDRKRQTFLIIDDLDLDWVDDRLRFDLIQALFQAVSKLRSIQNVKVVVALRDDLLDLVLGNADSYGFQREKFNDYYLRLQWPKDQLKALIDKRISKLYKSQYTTENVTWDDISIPDIDGKPSFDYLVARTFLRPRDLIIFVNLIIKAAGGNPVITKKNITSAEVEYSEDRRRSIEDEWKLVYPYLALLVSHLKNHTVNFLFNEFSEGPVDELALQIATRFGGVADNVLHSAKSLLDNPGKARREEFARALVVCLYRVGVVGIRLNANSGFQFSYANRPTLRGDEISLENRCYIHPMLWQALGKNSAEAPVYS